MIFEVFGLNERGFGLGLFAVWLYLRGLALYCTRRFFLPHKNGAGEQGGVEIVDLILRIIDHQNTKTDCV